MARTTASKQRLTRPQLDANHMVNCKIDIRPLKTFVHHEFPENSPLRKVLLAERDILDALEFLAKMETSKLNEDDKY